MKRDLALWTGVLGGPLVWLASFLARFSLVPWACTSSKGILFAVTITAGSLCAACGALAWRQLRTPEGAQHVSGDALSRSRFMAIGGVALSAACFLIVLTQAIPELLLGACG